LAILRAKTEISTISERFALRNTESNAVKQHRDLNLYKTVGPQASSMVTWSPELLHNPADVTATKNGVVITQNEREDAMPLPKKARKRLTWQNSTPLSPHLSRSR